MQDLIHAFKQELIKNKEGLILLNNLLYNPNQNNLQDAAKV